MSNALIENEGTTYWERSLGLLRDYLRPIMHLIEDPSVNEVQINGPNIVFARRGIFDELTGIEISSSQIKAASQIIASINEKVIASGFESDQVGRKRLLLSARLPGIRIEAILPPAAVNGPALVVRKHAVAIFPFNKYVEQHVMTPEVCNLLMEIAKRQESVLVAGPTYSGKTTFVNAFIAQMPPTDRLFVIELVHELRIEHENAVLVECDPDQGITPQDALMSAMRMSPSRIVVGELRGPEAMTFLEACATGHAGIATIHADSAPDALVRFEDLLLQANRNMPLTAIKARVARNIQWVLHIALVEGKRKLTGIYRINGVRGEHYDYSLIDYSTGKAKENYESQISRLD